MSEEQTTPEENQPPKPQPPTPPGQNPFPNQNQFPPQGGFNQPGGGFQYGMQQTLPNATAVLVLGIVSIVFCCCYGVLGLVPAIIALVLAKKDRANYVLNPAIYTESSYKNLNAGRICAIIGLILNILSLLYYGAIIFILGTGALSDPQKIQEMLKGLQ